jgi:mannose-1-phosphate guanylyltransferase/mannose-6-phosphate isomerase
MKIYPVIMCGGSGTRLWPVSTSRHPKQFVPLLSEESLFQQTIRRMLPADDAPEFAPPTIVSNARYLDLIEAQLANIGVSPLAILLEPCARNTGAVAAVAAEFIDKIDPDGLVILLPSDHFIGQPAAFRKAVTGATAIAAAGHIVTFGVSPDRPETGFGYIKAGKRIADDTHTVDAFREKPNRETAMSYLEDGAYTWNAGIFLFPARLMREELKQHAPDLLETATEALRLADITGVVHRIDEATFSTARSISFDYAVMEHTQAAAVVGPLSCAWNDVGTWPAVGHLQASSGPVPPVLIDAENCTVHSDDGVLVAALGVEDLVIAVRDGSVLVMSQSRAQDVKLVIDALKARGLTDRY